MKQILTLLAFGVLCVFYSLFFVGCKSTKIVEKVKVDSAAVKTTSLEVKDKTASTTTVTVLDTTKTKTDVDILVIDFDTTKINTAGFVMIDSLKIGTNYGIKKITRYSSHKNENKALKKDSVNTTKKDLKISAKDKQKTDLEKKTRIDKLISLFDWKASLILTLILAAIFFIIRYALTKRFL